MGKAFDTFANREKLIKLHLMQINKQKTQMLYPYTASSVFHSKQATPSGFEKCTGDSAPILVGAGAPKNDRITRIRWDGQDKGLNNDYRGLP